MIKRPLNPQFAQAVQQGRKFTTIRPNPWPYNVPIMLYHWSGKPYRSKHNDVCPVKVLGHWPILITRNDDDSMKYEFGMENDRPIYETEGFESPQAMDAWFRPLVKQGETIQQTLMRFSLIKIPNA